MEYTKNIIAAVNSIAELCTMVNINYSIDNDSGIVNIYEAGLVSLVIEYSYSSLFISGQIKYDGLKFTESVFKALSSKLVNDFFDIEMTELNNYSVYGEFYNGEK